MNTVADQSLRNRTPMVLLFKTNGVLTFIWKEDAYEARYRIKLLLWSCSEIRTIQQIWIIFNSFQMTEDGRTPFILKMIGTDVLF